MELFKQNEPTSHCRQLPDESRKKPETHAHELMLDAPYDMCQEFKGHETHDDAPKAGWKVPRGHGMAAAETQY